MQARELELCLERLTVRRLVDVCRDLGLPCRGRLSVLAGRVAEAGADPVLGRLVADLVRDKLVEQRQDKRRRPKRPREPEHHVRSLLPQFESVATAATDEERPAAPPCTPSDPFFSPVLVARAVPPFPPPRYTPQF